jgi:hypothetical protein
MVDFYSYSCNIYEREASRRMKNRLAGFKEEHGRGLRSQVSDRVAYGLVGHHCFRLPALQTETYTEICSQLKAGWTCHLVDVWTFCKKSRGCKMKESRYMHYPFKPPSTRVLVARTSVRKRAFSTAVTAQRQHTHFSIPLARYQ